MLLFYSLYWKVICWLTIFDGKRFSEQFVFRAFTRRSFVTHILCFTLCEKFPYSEFFWSVFSLIRTEYGKILPKTEKLQIRTLFTQSYQVAFHLHSFETHLDDWFGDFSALGFNSPVVFYDSSVFVLDFSATRLLFITLHHKRPSKIVKKIHEVFIGEKTWEYIIRCSTLTYSAFSVNCETFCLLNQIFFQRNSLPTKISCFSEISEILNFLVLICFKIQGKYLGKYTFSYKFST